MKQYTTSRRIVHLHSFLIHNRVESVDSTVVVVVIVVVNVVFTLSLLCRDVDWETVLRAYVTQILPNCPKILIVSFRHINAQTTDVTRQQYDDDNDRNGNDEGLFVLDDNTDNAVDARSVKSLQGVVRSQHHEECHSCTDRDRDKRIDNKANRLRSPSQTRVRHESLPCIESSHCIRYISHAAASKHSADKSKPTDRASHL